MHVEKPNNPEEKKKHNPATDGNFSERRHVAKAEKELQRIVLAFFDNSKHLSEEEKVVIFNAAQREWKAKTIIYNKERPKITIAVSAFAERVASVYQQIKDYKAKQHAKPTEVLPGSDTAAEPADEGNKEDPAANGS